MMHSFRMITMTNIFFCVILLFVSSAFSDVGPGTAFKKYQNVRFAYEISYPEALLLPQGESENGDGQRFVSKESDAEMLVWGSYNTLEESLKSNYQRDTTEKSKDNPDKRVTYKHLEGNSYVVSGYIGEKIFYQKTMNVDKVDAFLTFNISYPITKKKKYDPVVSIISKSFRYIGTPTRKPDTIK